jgi:hypothetical protein
MYDENFKNWAGINEEGVPETPWGIEAIGLIQQEDIPHDIAREVIIILYLKEGEARPLAQLFHQRITPSPGLMSYVAVMLAPEVVSKETLCEQYPFGLTTCNIEKAKIKRPRSKIKGLKHRFLRVSDNLARLNVKAKNEGSGYDAAIEELAMLEGLEKETIRSATRKKKPASE